MDKINGIHSDYDYIALTLCSIRFMVLSITVGNPRCMEQCVVIGAVQGKHIYFSNCVRILRFLVYKIGRSEKPSDYFDHVMNEDSSGSVKKFKCCIL